MWVLLKRIIICLTYFCKQYINIVPLQSVMTIWGKCILRIVWQGPLVVIGCFAEICCDLESCITTAAYTTLIWGGNWGRGAIEETLNLLSAVLTSSLLTVSVAPQSSKILDEIVGKKQWWLAECCASSQVLLGEYYKVHLRGNRSILNLCCHSNENVIFSNRSTFISTESQQDPRASNPIALA